MATVGDLRREGGARRHAGELLMAETGSAAQSTDITAGPGGVMTDDVGVVTGDLTLRTELDGRDAVLRVQYKDAAEWYSVTGGRAALADPADLAAVHTVAVGLLNRPEG
ncbi:hypothetical protein O7626_36020 [Micromonospora sp. WMMD1102]|uniref:hypothetical protein n=1 Tax=Micromonospora sp. WMMD1102 TaxID=3016105 RepID=UPI0024152A6E|nr:hypothetical protein [Micromonospora sp. WMMD1102]MDG4791244.1 hypothetical protein [Micromonospora sp. WMMD1102]